MEVWGQILSPRVEDRGDADGAAEVTRVASEGEQGVRGGAEEERVDHARIPLRQRIERVRESEDDVKIREGQQVGATGREPPFLGERLALRTMAIATGVVGDPHRAAVITRLPLVAVEVEVLHAKSDTLLEPEARAVQQRHDEPHHAVDMFDKPADFFSTEHDRQLVGHSCSGHMLDRPDIEAEYLTVQKHQRAQRLVLGGCADPSGDGEPREKCHNLGRAHRRRVLLLMKDDVPPNPGDVRLLGSATVVPQTHSGSHAIEELRRRSTFWRANASQRRAISHKRVATPANTVPRVMTTRAAQKPF